MPAGAELPFPSDSLSAFDRGQPELSPHSLRPHFLSPIANASGTFESHLREKWLWKFRCVYITLRYKQLKRPLRLPADSMARSIPSGPTRLNGLHPREGRIALRADETQEKIIQLRLQCQNFEGTNTPLTNFSFQPRKSENSRGNDFLTEQTIAERTFKSQNNRCRNRNSRRERREKKRTHLHASVFQTQ